MSQRKQIPGATMWFSDEEIKTLIEVFGCKNMDELACAARRYEDLFFMFNDEAGEPTMYPGEDFRLVLALAQHCIFENFTHTDQPLQRRYFERPKRGPGRTRKESLPDDLIQKFSEARKVVPTNEAAVQRLKALGVIPPHARSLKAKTILRYIQKDEQRKKQLQQEEFEELRRAAEIFKDFAPKPSDEPL